VETYELIIEMPETTRMPERRSGNESYTGEERRGAA
jgi:hypothetical protein